MTSPITLHKNESMVMSFHPKKILGLYYLLGRFNRYTLLLVFFFIATHLRHIQVPSPSEAHSILSVGHYYIRPVLGILLMMALVLFFYATMVTTKRQYTFTNHRCIIQSGFIATAQRIYPYDKIIDVSLRQSAIEKLLGIATVQLDTASTNIYLNRRAGRGNRIDGLSLEDCNKIVSFISEKISGIEKTDHR